MDGIGLVWKSLNASLLRATLCGANKNYFNKPACIKIRKCLCQRERPGNEANFKKKSVIFLDSLLEPSGEWLPMVPQLASEKHQ